MCKVRYFICPMSKNIVDSVIEMNSPLIGLLPSRRQVEFNGGYVNNWTTEEFVNYIKNKSNIVVERDHAGIGQGDENEYDSYKIDSMFMDIIHIDPWKKYSFFEDGLLETIKNINYISNINPKVKFEIGTEESIRKFNFKEIVELIQELKMELNLNQFENIQYICIQSGVGLDLINRKNTGTFNLETLRLMIEICRKFKKQSKEHNGDYLSKEDIQIRFDNGLDALNIGPEIAQIETEVYLKHMNEIQINEFYQTCLDSKKWVKWVNDNFDVTDKEKLIMVCGHYNFNNLPNIKIDNEMVKETIKNKLTNLISYV
jgi:hypothetical protein